MLKDTILVVDDSPSILALIVALLSSTYTLKLAKSASKALGYLESESDVDLILLDVMMPQTDGFTLCEQIKEMQKFKHIPIIFLTAKEDQKDMIKGFELGAQDYITKPFEPNVLLARVNTHIKLKKYNDQIIQTLSEKERLLFEQSKLAILGEMFENIAHQWKQPLSSISMSINNLELEHAMEGVLSEKTFQESIFSLKESTSYLAQTIDDFRDFIKTDTNKDTFDISCVVKKAISLLESKIKSRDIDIIHDIQTYNIVGFKNDLLQVLMSILGNAIDSVLCNLDKKRVTIESKLSHGYYIIKICDNGKGIDETILQTLFDKYTTTKKDTVGSGLGLYIAKEIVKQKFGGDIKAYNTQMGACFEIHIAQEDKDEN